ncbi:MAG: J domain-containing protein, partial [Proteobacteria bacterium]|nr:J domain-containing protein [Pseudomonadota bacterium]NDG28449.1 J domain-containing protein [Pseudomonadota bacterium]
PSYYAGRGQDREMVLNISFVEAAKGGERLIQFTDGKKLTVKIPAGVDEGSKIKLSGQGEPGFGGGTPGDLIIKLHVAEHPIFKREGNHIVLRLPVTFEEAVMGAEVEVPTVDGIVHLRIPPAISSGQRMKLAGKGILNAKTGQRGDQFVEVLIKVPKELPEEYRKAAEVIKNVPFNPREGLLS